MNSIWWLSWQKLAPKSQPARQPNPTTQIQLTRQQVSTMSNRLAELENNIGRRAANRKKPAKQEKMRSALEKMQQPRKPAPVAPPKSAVPAVAAQGLSGRVSRWPTRTA